MQVIDYALFNLYVQCSGVAIILRANAFVHTMNTQKRQLSDNNEMQMIDYASFNLHAQC